MRGVTPIDPVRARRARVARWNSLAKRAGYLCFAVAIAVFLVGLGTGFDSWVAATATVGLIVGSILLAPAIVIGYAVRAADREDRERGL